uniref:Uncharacterized protein n=1 Tax=Arundo donax TaxID=35708 RepID=A0A0A9B3P8_ARUDO
MVVSGRGIIYVAQTWCYSIAIIRLLHKHMSNFLTDVT